LRNLANKRTNKQTNKLTNGDENITADFGGDSDGLLIKIFQ